MFLYGLRICYRNNLVKKTTHLPTNKRKKIKIQVERLKKKLQQKNLLFALTFCVCSMLSDIAGNHQ